MEPGRAGESVFSKSDRSESESSSDSEKGKRPSASSMSEMPSDQTSDFTVYCAPCMRSGWIGLSLGKKREREITYTHVGGSADKRVRDGVDELARDTKIAYFDIAPGVAENVGGFDV